MNEQEVIEGLYEEFGIDTTLTMRSTVPGVVRVSTHDRVDPRAVLNWLEEHGDPSVQWQFHNQATAERAGRDRRLVYKREVRAGEMLTLDDLEERISPHVQVSELDVTLPGFLDRMMEAVAASCGIPEHLLRPPVESDAMRRGREVHEEMLADFSNGAVSPEEIARSRFGGSVGCLSWDGCDCPSEVGDSVDVVSRLWNVERCPGCGEEFVPTDNETACYECDVKYPLHEVFTHADKVVKRERLPIADALAAVKSCPRKYGLDGKPVVASYKDKNCTCFMPSYEVEVGCPAHDPVEIARSRSGGESDVMQRGSRLSDHVDVEVSVHVPGECLIQDAMVASVNDALTTTTHNADHMIGSEKELADVGRAKCGHVGECIIGNYYRCLSGCEGDAAPVPVKTEITEKVCTHRNRYGGKLGRYELRGVTRCATCDEVIL